MSIAVVNLGSSTLKIAVFDNPFKVETPIWTQVFENNKPKTYRFEIGKIICELFSNFDIQGVGHRVVHGGSLFLQPTLITPKVLKNIKKLSSFAPLHNPLNVMGIEMMMKQAPNIPQVAVFDTAFHQTLDPVHYTYAIPKMWLNQGIRRYGFHGINHEACIQKLFSKYGPFKNVVTCHLGSGCSLAAIKDGKSIDTTMGFTPLEGLVMGTRSGSIDPGILFHLLHQYTPNALLTFLNKKSGLQALAKTPDMRKIVNDMEENEGSACLAFAIFCLSVQKGIASMCASLGGIDALVFTGGIGQNSFQVREQVCKALKFLSVAIDKKKNESIDASDAEISSKKSSVRVFVFKSEEELLIAKNVHKIIN